MSRSMKSKLISKGKSLVKTQPKSGVKMPTKTNIKSVTLKNVNKEIKEINKLLDKDTNKNSGYLLRSSLKHPFKESRITGIDNKMKTKVANCTNVQNKEHTVGKISVKTHETEASADLTTKTNNRSLDENISDIGDFKESLDENDVSVESICCGNIFCDCKVCETLRQTLLSSNPKPIRNYKHYCDLCNKKFLRKSSLKEHEKSKCNTLKRFPCDYCGQGFLHKFSLKCHVRKHLAVSLKEEFKFSCNLCGRCYVTKSVLNKHIRSIHLGQKSNHTYSCKICSKIYKDQKGLSRHITNFHGDEKFECEHCSKIYNSKELLCKHIHSAHFQRRVHCTWASCLKTFASPLGLKNHMLFNHLKSLELCCICETCGKRFTNKMSLQRHILIHTGEKPYMCQVCGKSFRTVSNLDQHSRTHSDSRPFSCDLCPKTFRIKHHLRQHMSVHGMVHTSVKRKQRTN